MFNSFSNQNFGQNFNEGFTGNDCTIEGFCSVDPIVHSLLEVLLYELKQITYYYVKMQELGYENKKLKDKIINCLSLILVGYEFKREDFEAILNDIHHEKEAVKESFVSTCEKQKIDFQILKSNIKFEKFDISSLVNQGEQQAILRNKVLKSDTKNLYEIVLNLIKSASIRLIEIKCYTDDYVPEEDAVLKLFNSLNFSSISEEKLLKKINDFAKINFQIHKKLHILKEEYYGKISLNKVEVGVDSGHSILVSGQNLKDFEMMLEATKNEDINVYTHDGLIVAHAYPKFQKYSHLKGHFQMSLNILAGKGMTKIENWNFQPLIDSSINSEGFEHSHKIVNVKVGYDEKFIMDKVDKIIEKIKNKDIKHLIIVGLLNHSQMHSEYFEKMIEKLPDDYYIISAMLKSKKENVFFIDSFFNSSLIYKILAHVKEHVDLETFPISLFITTCNLHTLSHLFNLRYLGVKNIYLPKCTSEVITPNMMTFLKEKFDFKQISDNAEKDLKDL